MRYKVAVQTTFKIELIGTHTVTLFIFKKYFYDYDIFFIINMQNHQKACFFYKIYNTDIFEMICLLLTILLLGFFFKLL